MTAATLIIGDEILIGQVADINSAAISRCLNALGIQVVQMRAVGDHAPSISTALSELLPLVDIVIITGGLGPTKDDKTKTILAQYFGAKQMVIDPAALQNVQRIASQSGFEMNELNRQQALVPDVCTVLPNALGTAPGMWFERDGKVVIALPGVPFEMEHILHNEVAPRLQQQFATPHIAHSTVLIFGIAESMLAKQIEAWENALPAHLHLAYLPTALGIKLRLSTYNGSDHATSLHAIQQQFESLQTIIPSYFVGFGDHTLEHFVANILCQKKYTVATAESCTGGNIAALLTSVSGSSAYFKGGVVAYDNAVKERVLGVAAGDIEQFGAVSRQVVTQMAQGVQRLMGTDFAIAASGIAGPTGGTADKPVGTVWLAAAHPTGVETLLLQLGNAPRHRIVARASATALNLLRCVGTW
ncbi:CinA-like protein [Bacteroidia bacterium]|nr:CinA-like protein [Bacteroidia bacterium]